jgi:hypothetical protein
VHALEKTGNFSFWGPSAKKGTPRSFGQLLVVKPQVMRPQLDERASMALTEGLRS